MVVRLRVFPDEGGWVACGIDESIYTQGDSLQELMRNIREAVLLHFEDRLGRGETLRVELVWEWEVSESETATSKRRKRSSGCCKVWATRLTAKKEAMFT